MYTHVSKCKNDKLFKKSLLNELGQIESFHGLSASYSFFSLKEKTEQKMKNPQQLENLSHWKKCLVFFYSCFSGTVMKFLRLLLSARGFLHIK
jgi:hypothetical protein